MTNELSSGSLLHLMTAGIGPSFSHDPYKDWPTGQPILSDIPIINHFLWCVNLFLIVANLQSTGKCKDNYKTHGKNWKDQFSF